MKQKDSFPICVLYILSFSRFSVFLFFFFVPRESQKKQQLISHLANCIKDWPIYALGLHKELMSKKVRF